MILSRQQLKKSLYLAYYEKGKNMTHKTIQSLKAYLLTGILVTAPIAITIFLAIELIHLIDGWVSALIPEKYNPETYLPYGIPGLGVIILLIFLILVGIFTANFIGQSTERLWNSLIGKMPVVSGVYNALRKVFETLLGRGKETAFRQPVLIQYPRKGLWTIAFITGPVYQGVQKKIKHKLVSIYVPTTPNPTSGFLLYLSEKDVVPLDMRVDEALKIILSMGIVNPEKLDQKNSKKTKLSN